MKRLHGQKTIPSEENECGEGPFPPAGFESDHRFQPLIQSLTDSGPPDLPAGFTARVMAGLAGGKKAQRPKGSALPGLIFGRVAPMPRGSDTGYCFVLAGFFYFIFGVVLATGMPSIQNGLAPSSWLVLQPQLSLAVSILFTGLGIFILLDGLPAVRIAKLGALGYTLLSVLNTAALKLTPTDPFNPAAALFYLVGTIGLGLFLATVANRHIQRIQEREKCPGTHGC